MRYDGYVGEMPSAGQLILGTTPRDDFLLELGPLLDLRPTGAFLTRGRCPQGQRESDPFDSPPRWAKDPRGSSRIYDEIVAETEMRGCSNLTSARAGETN